MPTFHDSREFPYTPAQVFEVVADIERYPEFVPGYCEVHIRRREGDRLTVSQHVRVGPLALAFESVAELRRNERITIHSRDQPFRLLEISWQFEPSEIGCRVGFIMNWEARLRPMDVVLKRALPVAAGQMVAAFERRLEALHGYSVRRD